MHTNADVQPSFVSERLCLFPTAGTDISWLQELWDDVQVREYLFDAQRVSRDRARSTLGECREHAKRGCGLWSIHRRHDLVFLGCAGLLPTSVAANWEPSLKGLLEIMVALGPQHWGRGYAQEAMHLLLQYGFDHLDQPLLVAVNDLPNVSSEKLLRRLGFSPYVETPGPRHPHRAYLLARQAWKLRTAF